MGGCLAPSGYTRGQGWGLLYKAWIGYKRALNPRNGESFQDRLRWAVTIQNIQSDLGLQRAIISNSRAARRLHFYIQ
jgi:hypothetical protein